MFLVMLSLGISSDPICTIGTFARAGGGGSGVDSASVVVVLVVVELEVLDEDEELLDVLELSWVTATVSAAVAAVGWSSPPQAASDKAVIVRIAVRRNICLIVPAERRPSPRS
jgi:hypothetical protein